VACNHQIANSSFLRESKERTPVERIGLTADRSVALFTTDIRPLQVFALLLVCLLSKKVFSPPTESDHFKVRNIDLLRRDEIPSWMTSATFLTGLSFRQPRVGIAFAKFPRRQACSVKQSKWHCHIGLGDLCIFPRNEHIMADDYESGDCSLHYLKTSPQSLQIWTEFSSRCAAKGLCRSRSMESTIATK
jgi:hypothetical protein